MLAAQFLARPELVSALGAKIGDLENPAAQVVVDTLRKQGSTYANPMAILAAAAEHEITSDSEDFELIFGLIPDNVTQTAVADLYFEVKQETLGKAAVARFLALAESFKRNNKAGWTVSQLFADVGEIISDYRGGASAHKTDGLSILERMRTSIPVVRWAIGHYLLDAGFHGLDKNGDPIEGLLAQGEVLVISAAYKARKTTTAIWACTEHLAAGGTVLYAILEDEETTLTAKLIGARVSVEYWKVALFVQGKFYAPLNEAGREDTRKIIEGVAWYESVADRWFVLDAGNPDYNIYRWEDIVEAIYAYSLLHGVTLAVLDYVQLLSNDYEVLANIAKDSRQVAAKAKVAFMILSQQSNDSIKNGSAAGYLSAKGAGEFGANCHVGVELSKVENGSEILFWIKVARNVQDRKAFIQWEPATGALNGVSDFAVTEGSSPKPATPKAKKTKQI